MAESGSSRVPWLRLTAEAIAIVASILLALAIEAWWSGHQERQAERQLIEVIREDFETNQARLRSQIDIQDRLVAATVAFLDIVATADLGSMVSVPDTFVAATLATPTYDPITTNLDAALSSGQLALIRNSSVRQELANWRRVMVDLRVDEMAVRDVVNGLLLPELGGEVRLARAYENVVGWAVGDPDARARLNGAQRVQVAAKLESALATQLFNARFVVRDLNSLLDFQTALLQVINDELGPRPGSS